MKNQPDQMKKLLKDLNNAFCKNPEWRQQIRENSFMDTTGFINKNLMAIKAKRPSENEPFLQTDFRVEFYQSTADGKLVCYSIHNENKKDVIRLYKKTIGETKHYDLISLF